MKQSNKVLMALGAIALGAAAVPQEASAQEADTAYQRQCDWLAQQSAESLEQFIKNNPDDDCATVAATLLAERATPALGGRASAVRGRY